MAQAKMPYLHLGRLEPRRKGIISKNLRRFPTVWSRVPDYGGYGHRPAAAAQQEHRWPQARSSARQRPSTSSAPTIPTAPPSLTASPTASPRLGWKIVGTETVPFQSVTDWRTQLAHIRRPQARRDRQLTEWSPASDATFFNQFIEQPTNSLLSCNTRRSFPNSTTDAQQGDWRDLTTCWVARSIRARHQGRSPPEYDRKLRAGRLFLYRRLQRRDALRVVHQQGQRSGRPSGDRQVHRLD